VNKLLLAVLLCIPGLCFATSSGCSSWPTNMAIVQMKNAGITTPARLDESKTKAVLLMLENIEPGLSRQIHEITFHEKTGREFQVITENYAGREECSMSSVSVWVVSRKLGSIESVDFVKQSFHDLENPLPPELKATR